MMAKKEKMNEEKLPTFEEAMEQLEQIVEELEGGELTLDESLARYEKGVKAVKRCRDILDSAEKKLQILLSDEEGSFREEDFEEEPS